MLLDPYRNAAASGDSLWSNVWMLLPLDDALDGDVGPNGMTFVRTLYADYFSDNADADILAGAAKFGAAGWSAASDDGSATGNVYEADITSFGSGVRVWGTQDWCAEGWVRVADITQPVSPSQARLLLRGDPAAGTRQLINIGTRTGRVYVDIQRGATGTVTIASATVGTLSSITNGHRLVSTAAVIPSATYCYMAVIRYGSTIYLTVDGAIVGQFTITTLNLADSIYTVTLGGPYSAGSGQGDWIASGPYPSACGPDYLDDWRVTLGNARYTSFPHAVPIAAHPTSA